MRQCTWRRWRFSEWIHESKDATVPLSIDRAQRHTPEIRAELSQLGNVISYLHECIKLV